LCPLRWLVEAGKTSAGAASAQNIAIVNGKAVPKSRVDTLLQQAERAGQKVGPSCSNRRVTRWCCARSSPRRPSASGLAASADYRAQMELARQSILIRELFDDYRKKNPVTDEEAKAEYDKFKAQATGTEYRARHILVEKEDEAKALIPRSRAAPSSRIWPRSTARTRLGRQRRRPRLRQARLLRARVQPGHDQAEEGRDDRARSRASSAGTSSASTTRARPQFPAFDEVKGQIKQRLEQGKLQKFQEELRAKAKTDYKFPQ
jgi:peptidyl-prolyl cis-trans isomerase C